MASSRVIRVTNIAPQATRDQIQTLFQFVGKVEEIKLYPTIRDVAIPVSSRMSFVKFVEKDHVGISQHLNNTVFIDRALIIVPFEKAEIPDEHTAMQELVQSNGVLGITNEQQLPAHVSNVVDGAYYITKDPTFAEHGVPEYPPLPCTLEYGQVEEIRRTVVVGNLAPDTDTQQLMDWMAEAGEVKYARLCGRETDTTRACLIEFSEQSAVVPAIQRTGTMLNGRPLAVAHAAQAIAKPQIKTNELAMREIEEAMRRAQEQQSLISSTMVPVTSYMDDNKRSKSRSRRSRSRSRGGRRYRSRSRGRYRRSRSRSRRRSRSRKRSPARKRSRSRDKKSSRRSRSRERSRRHRSRSKSRDKKDKDKSRDKDKGRDKDKEKSSSDSKKKEDAKAERKEDAAGGKDSRTEDTNKKSPEPHTSSKSKDTLRTRSRSPAVVKKRSRSRSPAVVKKRSRSRSRHRSRSPKRISGRGSRASPSRSRRSRSRSPRRRVASPPRRRRSRTPPPPPTLRRRSRSPVRKRSRSPRRASSPSRSSRSRRSPERRRDRSRERDSKRESKSDRRDKDRKSDKVENKPPAPRNYDEEEKGFDDVAGRRSSSRESSPRKPSKEDKTGGDDDMDISD